MDEFNHCCQLKENIDSRREFTEMKSEKKSSKKKVIIEKAEIPLTQPDLLDMIIRPSQNNPEPTLDLIV
jgi:hypothetical protein